MGKTYRAVEITKPGLSPRKRSVVAPGAGQVRIRVEACGVCHSDAGTVEGQLPGVVYPRVPGHEAIASNRRNRSRRHELAGRPARRCRILWWRRRNLPDLPSWRHSILPEPHYHWCDE